jgi:hypothetical protein
MEDAKEDQKKAADKSQDGSNSSSGQDLKTGKEADPVQGPDAGQDNHKEQGNEPAVSDSNQQGSCYRYEDNGQVLVFTQPGTNKEFVLDVSGTKWVPRGGNTGEDDNQSDKPPSDQEQQQQQPKFDGKTYKYEVITGSLSH